MKKIFTIMAAALVLGGCTKGEDMTPANNTMANVRFAAGTTTIDVRSTRADGQTYTGVIGINPEGESWEVAPQSDVLGWESTLSTTSNALSISGTAVKDGAVQIKSTGAGDAEFVAAGVAEGALSISEGVVTLAANGNGTELTNDYIYAATATPVNGNATVAFAFSHVMAKMRIELYEQSYDNAKITDGVTISGVSNLALVRDGQLDITNGEVSATGTSMLAEMALNTEYFVLPQTIEAAKTFTVTFNGKEYPVAIPEGGMNLSAGKCRVIRLLVTGSGITFTATLEEWADENTDINIQ